MAAALRYRLSCLTVSIFLLLLNPLLLSCGHVDPGLIEIDQGDSPFFVDDASPDSLINAIDQHLIYLSTTGKAHSFDKQFGLAQDEFYRSLSTFRELLVANPDPIRLNQLIRTHFQLYQATGRDSDQEMLVTGYYEPIFEGSLKTNKDYRYPLYSHPPSLITSHKGENKMGRLDDSGRLVPFWTRREIETANLLEGHEMAWLKDRFDAYLLQIQGSGRIMLPDGTTRAVHYAASNGLTYQSLGKLFVDEQIMTREEVSIDAIRTYFGSHPEQMERMLHHNPRYIFFKWGDDRGPRGSLGQVLTADRSIAVDHTIFPSGAIGYLVSRRPIFNDNGTINHWKTFGRFVLPQDSGAAIKGPGRVDLFMGNDYYAEQAAGSMKEKGSLFFLLPRTEDERLN
ncbi:MAG: MltA domain-containing protein [Desulfofustis sp.]|nr:MltA domain-containing protein [Desulfofustis sp.]